MYKLKLDLPSLPAPSFESTLSLPQFASSSPVQSLRDSSSNFRESRGLGSVTATAPPLRVSPSQAALADRTVIARASDEARNLRVNAGAYESLDPK